MVPRQPEPREMIEGGPFRFENEDVSSHPPRSHLKGILEIWNDDGTRNPGIEVTPPTNDAVPTSSKDTSQASAEDHHASREPTPSTDLTSLDQPDHDSSADATNGGSVTSVRSDDEVEHIWYRGDDSAQSPPTPTRFELRLEERGHIRRRSKNRTDQPLVVRHQQQEMHDHHAPQPINTATRIALLVILTAVTFLNFAVAIHTIHLAHQKATTLKHTKFTLLLTTHIVAICAAFGAVVLRRPPTEALLYFVVIVLLGNMVRREAECFF